MGTGNPDCNDAAFSVDGGDGTIDYTDTNNTNSNNGQYYNLQLFLHCVRILIFFFSSLFCFWWLCFDGVLCGGFFNDVFNVKMGSI